MWKTRILVWKSRPFAYNPRMSPFKTKKIPRIEKKWEPSHPQKADSSKHKPDSPKETTLLPKEKTQNNYSRKLLLSLVLVFACVFFFSKVGIEAFKWNEKNGSEHVDLPSLVEEFATQKVEGTVNILIAGIGWKWHDGSDLTDSIMLASLDGERKEVTLLSIPRDLYVAYPEKLWAWRINALYDLWKRRNVGIQYLAAKVSEITGQTIDHYLVIDFAGFKKVIDLLWGVSIDVPEDLTDREYPDNNWGYEIFSVKKWPQIFNGETALKYARSRHSTSDFDRSERQQLIIKSIKEKASDLGIISDIDKLGEIYSALINNLDTDLSLAKLGEIAFTFSDISSESISIVTLSDFCLSLTKCQAWGYLYAPSRDLFGWNAVIVPENAHANQLSYYTDIRRFVDLTFRFPTLRNGTRDIVIIHDPSKKKRAQEIGFGLAKLWFPISFEKTLTSSTGTIENSHINFYYYEDLKVGIAPDSVSILGLKHIEPGIAYTAVEKNEYINTSGPKIEIVIGKDGNEFFKDLRYPYYLPAPPKATTSWEQQSGSLSNTTKNPAWKVWEKNKANTTSISSEVSVGAADGWENF
jgi:LCP family protein required for cell wall assembly